MSVFHKKAEKKGDGSHSNFMDGKSFFVNPLTTFMMAATSSFFGEKQYYRDGIDKKPYKGTLDTVRLDSVQKYTRSILNPLDPEEWRSLSAAQIMEMAIDKAIEYDPEEFLKLVVDIRRDWHIRTTPQVALVRAAHHPKMKGTGLIRKYGPMIMKRADAPSVQLAYHLLRFKDKPIPNQLKKAWADFLEKQSEYHLAKYRMENKEVKTVDVVNLCHAKSEAIGKLMKGELTNTDKTWEAIISAEGSNTKSWTKAVDIMGHMALRSNLRNLVEHKVPLDVYVEKYKAGAKDGEQLPFRYYSAFKALQSVPGVPGRLLDANEECLMLSLDNLPKFEGRLAALCDNSGSAKGATTSSMGTMAVNEIANLQGIIAGLCADEGHLGIFGDKLEMMPVRRKASVFDQVAKAGQIGSRDPGGTEHGIWLFWDKAIKNKEHWDTVFVFSDMQAGHGGLYGTGEGYSSFAWPGYAGWNRHIDVPKLVMEYRKKVNPNVMVYLVQVAGYTDTIMPEFYDKTYILGGWGEGLIRFAKTMSSMNKQ